MTLRTFLSRLIWWCVMPLLLLAVGLSVIDVRDALDDRERDAMRLAHNAAVAIDHQLSERIGALQLLALSPMANDPARWPELYREAQRFHQVFGSHVVFADAQGRLRFHTGVPFGQPLAELVRPQGHSALHMALASGRPAVGDLADGLVVAEPVVAIAVPGGFGGVAPFVLLCLATPAQFAERLAGVALPNEWTVALRDSRDTLIARSRPLAEAPAPDRGHGQRLASPTALAAWHAEIERPWAGSMAPVAQTAAVTALAVLGATLASVLGGHWASRRLARSVRLLAGESTTIGGAIHIAEVQSVRKLLEDAADARDRAETERSATEARLRDSLQQALTALQVSEAQLRGIFDSASDAIVTADDTQAIVMANPAAARMFGVPLEGLVGSPLERLLPERFRGAHRHSMLGFAETGATARRMGSTGRALAALRADGSEFPIDAAISQAQVDGRRLYTVIVRDITDQLRVQMELQASHTELQRLIAAQDGVQEDERRRIARELHDDLQQTLAAILMEAGSAGARLGTVAAPPDVVQALDRIDRLGNAAIVSTRRIVNDLRPQMLEELGLVAALEALARRFAESTGVACEVDAARFDIHGDEAGADAVATCLYRVAQESLNNVAKHARARHAWIRLSSGGRDGVTLTVRDDGGGMLDADRRKPGSIGLLGMRERVRAAGGSVRVSSEAGGGTTVWVKVPLGSAAARAAPRAGR